MKTTLFKRTEDILRGTKANVHHHLDLAKIHRKGFLQGETKKKFKTYKIVMQA
jgi:hypothetical protein